MPKDTEPLLTQADIDDIRQKQAKQCQTVHLIIDQLLSKIPLADQVLVEILAEKLPNKHGPPRAHQVYMENLISITGTRNELNVSVRMAERSKAPDSSE